LQDDRTPADIVLAADPREIDLPPRPRALAGIAALLTEAPWMVGAEEIERLRGVGLSDEGIVQAITVAAMFNYFTRVADGTGIDFDYLSPLPRIKVDRAREPLPRPEPASFPRREPVPGVSLARRPGTQAAVSRWKAYAFDSDAPLSRRDRAVLRRTAAFHVADAVGLAEHGDLSPRDAREFALAAYAEKLTRTPWAMEEADLAPLRREGLDDRGLLHVISVTALENLLARLRLGLGEAV
jgi:alkylhydroperoxidase family enzyme